MVRTTPLVDNSTPYDATAYEGEARRTIPYHAEILAQTIACARAAVADRARWLDTGSGPGRLVAMARADGGAGDPTAFSLAEADPSAAMLALAHQHNPDLPDDRFLHAGSEDLPEMDPLDVITAVQCHHYLDPSGRERAVRRCRSLLRPGGAFVLIQRRRWATFLRSQGRTQEAAAGHLAREGTQFFPLRPSDHRALLDRAGFGPVELNWRATARPASSPSLGRAEPVRAGPHAVPKDSGPVAPAPILGRW